MKDTMLTIVLCLCYIVLIALFSSAYTKTLTFCLVIYSVSILTTEDPAPLRSRPIRRLVFSRKYCWPRNGATQHWNNRFRIYGIQIPSHRVIGLVRMWSRLKLPQKCRSSKTILGRAKLSVRNATKIWNSTKKCLIMFLHPQSPSQNLLWILWGLFDWNGR